MIEPRFDERFRRSVDAITGSNVDVELRWAIQDRGFSIGLYRTMRPVILQTDGDVRHSLALLNIAFARHA